MKLIIDIPKKTYQKIKEGIYDYGDMNVIIQNGTPYEERPQWIPCSERLPEEDDLTQVLASVNERYALYKIILLPSKSVKTEYKLGHIDAWKPLPEPYQKEGDMYG